jgi:uncharacterized membrane protein
VSLEVEFPEEIKDSTINNITNSSIENTISNSNIHNIDNSTITESINNSTFEDISNSTINGSIYNCIFKNVYNCKFYSEFTNVNFKELDGCTFNVGNINNVVSFYGLTSESFNEEEHFLLYNSSKRKEIYIHNGKTQIICVADVIFYRGMIIMHSGTEEIPLGWAPCDG